MVSVDDILRSYRLPPRLDPYAMPTNPWFVFLEQEGLGLARYSIAPRQARFCFYESTHIQAVAVQTPDNLVAMSGGMLSILCRLCATITSRGIMPAMGKTAGPDWQPDFEKSFQPVRSILDDATPFDWLVESAGWIHDVERTTLYLYLLLTTFRFVVLHELGHLTYDHALRRQREGSVRSSLSADSIGQKMLEPADAMSSQARECAADFFAFGRLLEILDKELDIKKDNQVAQIIRKHMAPDPVALASYALTALYLYFRMSDRHDWQEIALNRLSHPPAPFRLRVLCACLYQNTYLNISREQAVGAIKKALDSGDMIMSVALNTYPNPHWMKLLESNAFDQHFYKLYDEMPKWLGPLPTRAVKAERDK